MPAVPAPHATGRTRVRHVALAATAAVGATVLAAAPALAHPGHDASLAAGAVHPFLGVDHVLAMTTVGALAVLQRRRLALPAAFVLAMALGGVLGLVGVPFPGAEVAVAASVVALGVALAAARRARHDLVLAAVALAGLAHGHVHADAVGGAAAAGFLAAVLASTVVLHGLGAVAGAAIEERHALRRTVAVLVAGAGAGLVVAAIGA